MSTINPLFLDSTKPIGDKVVTSVELLSIILRDGDALYFEVTDEFGFVQKFAMKMIETKKSVKYTAEVWLKYQHKVNYRFLIMSEGEDFLVSDYKETLAGHVIIEKWNPISNLESFKKNKDKKVGRKTNIENQSRGTLEKKMSSSKPLCKPQFFDQLKSLLDDLI